jgi:hypothetical protein
MKRRVTAPDGREWVVQLVWWPRSSQGSVNFDAATAGRDAELTGREISYGAGAFSGLGPVIGLLVDAIVIIVWPFVLALRVLFRRRWLIEAYSVEDNFEGAAWKVRGLRASRAAVGAIADGIEAGNRKPAPPGAAPAHFRVKLGHGVNV